MSSALYPLPREHSVSSRSFMWMCAEARIRPRGKGREEDPTLKADRAAMAIARALGEIGPWLAASAAAYKKDKVWWRHGYARLEDHCREVFHRSGRWLRDLAALGDAFKKEERLQAA